MDAFSNTAEPDLKQRIANVRRSAVDFCKSRAAKDSAARSAIFDRADRHLKLLETWLLDTEQQQMLALNPLNHYYLHVCAYLLEIDGHNHDHIDEFSYSSNKESPNSDDSRPLLATLVRDHWAQLGLEDSAEAREIATICREAGGGLRDRDDDALTGAFSVDMPPVNRPLLAAGLQMARMLDLTDAGVRRELHGLLPPAAALSLDTLAQSYDQVVLEPHRLFPGTIRVKITCRHAEVHRALKRYETRVQKRLGRLNRLVSPRFLYADCLFEITPEGYAPLDLKFTVDSSAALQLFTGNRLYDDRRAFLRELLQNAVDACRLRQLMEKDYQPAITIRFQDDIRIVSVADNGIGMDRQWIEKYFLQIGISFYQSSRIRRIDRDQGIGLSFISQFGIGFLSSFLVAEKIIIRTRKAGATGLMITIHDLKEYFDVRPLDGDHPVGTEVTLHLRPSRAQYCRSLEYIGYLKTNIRFLKVPVHLVDENGKTTSIGMERLAYPRDKKRGTAFVASLDLPTSEGYLLLQAKKQTSYIQGLEPALGGVSIFQDGIFVTQVDTLLPEGARQHVIGRINLEGADKCELSMDRNRIFWTEEHLGRIKQAVRLALADVTNRFMAAVQAQDAPEATRTMILNQLAVFFDFNEVDDALHAVLCPPIRDRVEKRFRDFVRIHFAHAIKTVAKPAADGYSEKWQQVILEGFRKRGRG